MGLLTVILTPALTLTLTLTLTRREQQTILARRRLEQLQLEQLEECTFAPRTNVAHLRAKPQPQPEPEPEPEPESESEPEPQPQPQLHPQPSHNLGPSFDDYPCPYPHP